LLRGSEFVGPWAAYRHRANRVNIRGTSRWLNLDGQQTEQYGLGLFDFIEGFYNPHRRHSSLGQLSPAEFERRWSQEQTVVA